MEPIWSKQISSTTVCSTYYIIFIAYVLFGIVGILGLGVGILQTKLPIKFAIAFGFQGLLTLALGTILAFFQYLVCSRALLTAKLDKEYFLVKSKLKKKSTGKKPDIAVKKPDNAVKTYENNVKTYENNVKTFQENVAKAVTTYVDNAKTAYDTAICWQINAFRAPPYNLTDTLIVGSGNYTQKQVQTCH